MAKELEDAKGIEGSITLGARGKVRVLMIRELKTAEGEIKKSVSSERKRLTVSVAVDCGVLRKRTSSNSAGANRSSDNASRRRPGTSIHREVHQTRYTPQRTPMLGSEDTSVDETPRRAKPGKKRSRIVEIVDFNCGITERAWSVPITNQLRRLSFSRLSD